MNLKEAPIWVKRLKNGLSVEQPVAGDELAPSDAGWLRAVTICLGFSSPSGANRSPANR